MVNNRFLLNSRSIASHSNMHCDSKLWYNHPSQSDSTSWLETKNSNQHLRNYICNEKKIYNLINFLGEKTPGEGTKATCGTTMTPKYQNRRRSTPEELEGNTAIHWSSSTDTREDELEWKRSTATRDPPLVSGSFRVESDRSPNRNHGNWNQYGAQKIAEKDEKIAPFASSTTFLRSAALPCFGFHVEWMQRPRGEAHVIFSHPLLLFQNTYIPTRPPIKRIMQVP